MTLFDNDNKSVLKSAVIKQQLESLDLDLARHVILSALSLDSSVIFKSLQLMSHLQMMRFLARDSKALTEKQKRDFEDASHNILPETYLDRRSDKPQ